MRFTLPKNRTTPLILFAILGISVSLISGIYYISHMATYIYKARLEYYDSLTDNTALILKQEIKDNYQSIQAYAEMAANAEDLSKDNMEAILPLFSENKIFADIAVLGMDGKGYDLSGDEIDASGEDSFIKAAAGQMNNSDEITFTADQTPVITYAAPIRSNGVVKGVLLARAYAQLKNTDLYDKAMADGSQIYLINEKNMLVSFVQDTDIASFNYNETISNGIFLEDNLSEQDGMNFDLLVSYLKNQGEYLWNEKPLGMNHWSVLIGRTNVISPTVKDIFELMDMMWIFIIAGTFLLYTIMIIFQIRANGKVVKTLYLDPVTGGGNWYKFRINVEKILNSKQFWKRKYTLINFDINRFKIINDAYGYQKGDEVLKDIYYIIKAWARQGEPYTRYAADQFYILLYYQEKDELAQRIYDLNSRLHQLRYTSVSKIYYGVYHITDRNETIDRMGEFASIAKNNIKGNAEVIISYFDDKAKSRLLEEEEIEKSMNDALRNDEFNVFLQPKYTVKEETVSGAEALVRWFNRSGNMVSPGYFIPVFEKNGFITELDYYMLRKVCEVIRGWIEKGYTPLPVSVNISRLHFANPHLAEIIKDIVDDFGVPHSLIELELTESAFLQNKQTMINTVTRMREYGFLVSMDDFGAGYSSLNSLKDLPLDTVKLDGELFRMTNEVERGLTVIRNTINMAKDLHMQVVAECIETKEQVDFLYTVGCDLIQGFYYAKPMPVDQFERQYISRSAID